MIKKALQLFYLLNESLHTVISQSHRTVSSILGTNACRIADGKKPCGLRSSVYHMFLSSSVIMKHLLAACRIFFLRMAALMVADLKTICAISFPTSASPSRVRHCTTCYPRRHETTSTCTNCTKLRGEPKPIPQ